MFLSNKCFTLHSVTVISTLLLGTAGYIPAASAVNYSVVAGSQVLLKTVNGPFTMATPSGSVIIFGASSFTNTPLLGGFSKSNGSCVRQTDITRVDGWTGIKINNMGIIAGFTGKLSGGVSTIKKYDDQTQSTTYRGGLLFDKYGYAAAEGDVLQDAANRLCGAVPPPYLTGGYDNRNNMLAAPDNAEWGNKLAHADGYMWIYVSKDTPSGTYALDGVYLSQGYGYDNYANIDLTLPGDTLTVLPPPCTISVDSSITFDTTSTAGKKSSNPITYRCGEVTTATILDAYLIANGVGNTPTATELALTSANNKPGGVVRGYVGQGVNTDSANCTDTTKSLFFNGVFNTKLGSVTSGITQQIPLIWQLCLKGNEEPGLATGRVLLDIGYK